MKQLALVLLAFALVLRAAPLCAEPVAASSAALMADCAEMADGDQGKHEQLPEPKSLACHSCVTPIARLAAPDFLTLSPNQSRQIPRVAALVGALVEPPTPPPRVRG